MSEYRVREKSYRKLCRKAKTADWRYMVESQNSRDSINKLRKILEVNSRNALGVLNKPNGSVTEPGNDTLQYLLKAHFPSISETKETEYTEYKLSAESINGASINWINKDRLAAVFNAFKSKKSPGPVSYTHLTLPTIYSV